MESHHTPAAPSANPNSPWTTTVSRFEIRGRVPEKTGILTSRGRGKRPASTGTRGINSNAPARIIPEVGTIATPAELNDEMITGVNNWRGTVARRRINPGALGPRAAPLLSRRLRGYRLEVAVVRECVVAGIGVTRGAAEEYRGWAGDARWWRRWMEQRAMPEVRVMDIRGGGDVVDMFFSVS